MSSSRSSLAARLLNFPFEGRPLHRFHASESQRVFWRTHVWLPLAVVATLSWLLMGWGGDQWFADRLFAMQGHAWTLQSSMVFQDVLHAGGRTVSKMAWYAVFLTWLVALCVGRMHALRVPLAYLLASTLLATAVVGWMKQWTHVDCPWDLLRYGGNKAYHGLFARLPGDARAGQCFPAGHAGAGYAWVALYFFFDRTWPALKRWGLALGLAVGLTFGIAQQVRGAHFLSHDLWSLAISWMVALSLHPMMSLKEQA